jgi:hypothetical protein
VQSLRIEHIINETSRILDRVRAHRSLIQFVSDDQLIDLLEFPCADAGLKSRFLTEYLMRLWLCSGRGFDEKSALGGVLGPILARAGLEAQSEGIRRWLNMQAVVRDYALPVALEDIIDSPLAGRLRQELCEWQTSDGAVVLVNRPGCRILRRTLMLPFLLFEQMAFAAGEPLVRTARGEALPGLESGVRNAVCVAQRNGWLVAERPFQVVLPTLRVPCDIELCGGSASLPVLVAILRKNREITPRGALDYGATGVLTPTGILDAEAHDEETLRAKAEILRQVAPAAVLMPHVNTAPSDWLRLVPGHPVTEAVVDFVQSMQENDGNAVRERRIPYGHTRGIREELRKADAALDDITDTLRNGAGREDTLERLETLRKRFAAGWSLSIRHLCVRVDALSATLLMQLGRAEESDWLRRELLHNRFTVGVRPLLLQVLRQAEILSASKHDSAVICWCRDAERLLRELPFDRERKEMEWRMRCCLLYALGRERDAMTEAAEAIENQWRRLNQLAPGLMSDDSALAHEIAEKMQHIRSDFSFC